LRILVSSLVCSSVTSKERCMDKGYGHVSTVCWCNGLKEDFFFRNVLHEESAAVETPEKLNKVVNDLMWLNGMIPETDEPPKK
jgi:hypothetical protein